MKQSQCPAIIVAGTHSGVGKTTLSIALMAACRRRGLTVQAFKVGPDFIDPGFHRLATGRPSRNLDGWMLGQQMVSQTFLRATADADIAIIEGVMGMFDGASATGDSGSTAEIAKWVGAPALLLVDASGMARSAAAVVKGFEDFDPDVHIAGVIMTRVGGLGHYRYLEDAIRSRCRAEPLGWLGDGAPVQFSSRRLGLVTAREIAPTELDRAKLASSLADWLEAGVDVDRIISLLSLNRPNLELMATASDAVFDPLGVGSAAASGLSAPVRIGLAEDAAFCFYYQDNIDLLKSFGAEVVSWSPIHQELPRGLHGLYFGGGYPELHAERLAANRAALSAVRHFVERGGQVYAECGGLMYLCQAIVDANGSEFEMAGVFPARSRMRARLACLGYFEVEAASGSGLLPRGERIRGHQFRYSEIDPMPDLVGRAYAISSSSRPDLATAEGYRVKNCIASYVHLHFLSNPAFAGRMVDRWRKSEVVT